VGPQPTLTTTGSPPPESSGPSPTPQRSLALGQGEPTVRAVLNGLTVELWLDRTQLNIGDRLTALARASNRGSGTVTWESNICGYGPAPVLVEREREKSPYPPDDGVANEFRRQALDLQPYLGQLLDVTMIDAGNAACPAYSAPRPFKPGDSAEMRVAWDAKGTPGFPVNPGPATVRATFTYWEQGAPGPPEGPTEQISASIGIQIAGMASGGHSVSEYVDAALLDPAFKDWLNRQPIDKWINTGVAFWPNSDGQYPADPIYAKATTGAVDVYLFVSGRDGGTRKGDITFDASTFAVLGRHLEG
jgi:hypothetical protein